MGITAEQVKELRERTGVGMMDCKAALLDSEGDMEKAIDYLRKKGLAKAAKRAGRSANAGLIAKYVEGNTITLLELNCETDFVAKNDDFKALANTLCKLAAENKPADVAALSALQMPGESKTVADAMAEALAKIGESIKIGRIALLSPDAKPGKLVNYMHTGATIGVVVDYAVGKAETLENDAFKTMAYDIAMHVAAAAPSYLVPDAVPAEVIAREKDIYMEEARQSGKPEKILEKIATGKLEKFYKDTCLVKQDFVKDTELTVEGLVGKISKEIGDEIAIKKFLRIKVGEGA